MNIYVGNLPYTMTDETLKDLFSTYGEVSSVKIIIDRATGRSKGFAFVDMTDSGHAQQAIDGLNGKDVDGRTIRVNESQTQEPRRRRPL